MTGPFERTLRLAAAAVAAAAIVLTQLQPVLATRGVRIDAGRIAVDDELAPGQTYHLPTIGVSNPGDESATYTMDVGTLDADVGPDASWLEFEPGTFELGPGQTQPVRVTLRVPVNAAPGAYTALLTATIGSDSTSGVGVGAAAATRLTFTIRPADELSAWLNALGGWVTERQAWLVAAGLLIALAVAIRLARRHLAIEIRRR